MTETANRTEEIANLKLAEHEANERGRQVSQEMREVDGRLRTVESEDSKRRTAAARDGRKPSEAEQHGPALRERQRELPHLHLAAVLDSANLAVEVAQLEESKRAEESEQARAIFEDKVEQARPYERAKEEARSDYSRSEQGHKQARDRLSRAFSRLRELEENS